MVQAIEARQSCLVTGVPGSGRDTLIRTAAERTGVRVIEIDCLRTLGVRQLLRHLADRLLAMASRPRELAWIQNWSFGQPLTLELGGTGQARLTWHIANGKEWTIFHQLLDLAQQWAEAMQFQLMIVFKNFPHLRTWDRTGTWESHLNLYIQHESWINFVLVASVVGTWEGDPSLATIELPPVPPEILKPWVMEQMSQVHLRFDAESKALDLFLAYVQGHLGDTIALGRRVWTDYQVCRTPEDSGLLQAHHVHQSMIALIQDISVTFESLLLQLPLIQIRVLESLCLDPTDKPHAKQYIQKHGLSRGGSLQGALTSLQQKGLIYGVQHHYRIALPLFNCWLKQRLSWEGYSPPERTWS